MGIEKNYIIMVISAVNIHQNAIWAFSDSEYCQKMIYGWKRGGLMADYMVNSRLQVTVCQSAAINKLWGISSENYVRGW